MLGRGPSSGGMALATVVTFGPSDVPVGVSIVAVDVRDNATLHVLETHVCVQHRLRWLPSRAAGLGIDLRQTLNRNKLQSSDV